MNTTAIDRYLTARIGENAAWYQHKNRLNTAYATDEPADAFFRVLSLASRLSLGVGHTVMVVPKNSTDLAGDLLSPVLDYLAGFLTDEIQVDDFYEVFLIISSHRGDDSFNTQEILYKYRQFISQDKNKVSKFDVSVDELVATLSDVLMVYRLLGQLGDVDGLVNFMQHSHYFDEQSNVAAGTPLVFKQTDRACYLWSNRAYRAEVTVMRHIGRLCAAAISPFAVDNLPSELNDKQRAAVEMVSRQPFAIITGGPGTGKTYTVAQIVLALIGQNPDIDLALAAPTGKAAQRMTESLQNALSAAVSFTLPEPKTIHRLLGIGRHGTPRHHADNPLSHDVIVVDEASMLGAELSGYLFAAVKTGARLILLGDSHQLAAVEAGAVLADLCRVKSLQSHRTHLVESRRFHADSDVGKLAKLINESPDDTDKSAHAIGLINDSDELSFVDISKNSHYYNELIKGYDGYFIKTKDLLKRFRHLNDDDKDKEIRSLIDILNQYRVLSASHIGTAGDVKINEFISSEHRAYLNTRPSSSPWYHGRVVMVQSNRYDLGLYNGDVGVCMRDGGELWVYFDGKTLKKVSVGMLGGDTVATAYAMTVHKSQGSEFHQVAVVFDESSTRLLSKELIYTAVTRAKQGVHIFATLPALQIALSTPTTRTTGLGLL